MDKKEVAKKYLLSSAALYFFGAALLFVFLFALSKLSANPLSVNERLIISFLLPLIPLGSFTGFVVFGQKIKEIKTSHAALLVFFFPLVLAFVTAFGIIFIIPKIIISIIDLVRG